MELKFPIILDGATGTELQKVPGFETYDSDDCALLNSDYFVEMQRKYIEAGSNIIYTSTFSSNLYKMQEKDIPQETYKRNLELARLSRRAAEKAALPAHASGSSSPQADQPSSSGPRALVAGDLAPTGRFLYPIGDVRFDDLVEAYRVQVRGLLDGGVDLFAVETQMTLSDARAAIIAIREVSDKPILVSFSVDGTGRSVYGVHCLAALNVVSGMGASAFGLNCSHGPDGMLPFFQELGRHNSIPLLVKANAGLPEVIGKRTVYSCTPEEYCTSIKPLAEAGVSIFGGCCGTDARYIAGICKALESVKVPGLSPKDRGLLPLSDGKNAFYIPEAAVSARLLRCDRNFEKELDKAGEEPSQLISILLETEAELSVFEEFIVMASNPIALRCENEELLEKALRIFQGRALYEGHLPETILEKFADRYGLIY